MTPETYQYVWAASIVPQQRQINLLYDICDIVGGMDKITIMAVIVKRELHLADTETLSLYASTMRENIANKKKRKDIKMARRHRKTQLQADYELYRDCAIVLRETKGY